MRQLHAAPTVPRECRFCEHLSLDVPTHAPADTPWLRNEHYAALASIGALVPGWSLICPVGHALNLQDHYSRTEFWDFVEDAAAAVINRYGGVRVFEHGSNEENSATSCGTAHAHLHIVPLRFSLIERALRDNASTTYMWHDCFAHEIKALANGSEYLFVADDLKGPRTKGKLALISNGISQYFRILIASELGVHEEYNYKTHPNYAAANSAAELLRNDAKTHAEFNYAL